MIKKKIGCVKLYPGKINSCIIVFTLHVHMQSTTVHGSMGPLNYNKDTDLLVNFKNDIISKCTSVILIETSNCIQLKTNLVSTAFYTI